MEHDCIMEHICASLCVLTEALDCELSNGIGGVNTIEAGQVADIIKDLTEAKKNLAKADKAHAEACYYREVVEAMEKSEDEGDEHGYLMHSDSNSSENAKMDHWMHDMSAHKDGRYGMAYNEYLDARRHYSESKSQSDKDAMDMHANEYMSDAMTAMKDIHRMADPEMRKQMKAGLTKFIGELPA